MLHTLEPRSSHGKSLRSVWSWSTEICEAQIHTHTHTHRQTEIPCFYREISLSHVECSHWMLFNEGRLNNTTIACNKIILYLFGLYFYISSLVAAKSFLCLLSCTLIFTHWLGQQFSVTHAFALLLEHRGFFFTCCHGGSCYLRSIDEGFLYPHARASVRVTLTQSWLN